MNSSMSENISLKWRRNLSCPFFLGFCTGDNGDNSRQLTKKREIWHHLCLLSLFVRPWRVVSVGFLVSVQSCLVAHEFASPRDGHKDKEKEKFRRVFRLQWLLPVCSSRCFHWQFCVRTVGEHREKKQSKKNKERSVVLPASRRWSKRVSYPERDEDLVLASPSTASRKKRSEKHLRHAQQRTICQGTAALTLHREISRHRSTSPFLKASFFVLMCISRALPILGFWTIAPSRVISTSVCRQ